MRSSSSADSSSSGAFSSPALISVSSSAPWLLASSTPADAKEPISYDWTAARVTPRSLIKARSRRSTISSSSSGLLYRVARSSQNAKRRLLDSRRKSRGGGGGGRAEAELEGVDESLGRLKGAGRSGMRGNTREPGGDADGVMSGGRGGGGGTLSTGWVGRPSIDDSVDGELAFSHTDALILPASAKSAIPFQPARDRNLTLRVA